MTRTTLLDEVLPHCDVRLQHSALFRVPAGTAFHTALDLDLLRHPLIRALIAARTLPLGGTGPRTLRIADLTESPLGWSVLAERPGADLLLATLARPWRVGAPPPAQPTSRGGVRGLRRTRLRQDRSRGAGRAAGPGSRRADRRDPGCGDRRRERPPVPTVLAVRRAVQ